MAFIASPVSVASWKALAAILIGFGVSIAAIAVITSLLSAGASLILILIGIPIIALAIECARIFARVEIWRMGFVDDRPLIQRPHRPLSLMDGQPIEARIRAWLETEFLDSARWLDLVYVAVSFPLAMIEFIVAVVLWAAAVALLVAPIVALAVRGASGDLPLSMGVISPTAALASSFVVGLVLVPVAASASRGMAILHRYVVEGLLCISPAEALRHENERLRESRSAAVELEASELRRIERDLHDGAQQRLVMLAIDLSLAEDKVDSDPAAAKTLIVSARDQARTALAEIREVVRGTAPAILLDRGLAAALAAVAGRSAVPIFLDSDLPAGERLPHAVERAGYYVVSEALANIAKHAAATRVEVTLRREPSRLRIWVRDNGHGGAAIASGGGLAGLRDRVEALDGRLLLHSPAGGPTVLHVELPLPAAQTYLWGAPPPAPGPQATTGWGTPAVMPASVPAAPDAPPPPPASPPLPPASPANRPTR
jgi:signal transduction histidine kinase